MSKRILVVDDDDDLRFLLRTVFRRQGFDVVEAATGEEAVDRALAEPPDAVVIDVIMPGMGGHEACRVLRNDPRTADCAIIMMTGKAVSETGAEMADCADEWLRKPFDIEELAAVVRASIEERQRRG